MPYSLVFEYTFCWAVVEPWCGQPTEKKTDNRLTYVEAGLKGWSSYKACAEKNFHINSRLAIGLLVAFGFEVTMLQSL